MGSSKVNNTLVLPSISYFDWRKYRLVYICSWIIVTCHVQKYKVVNTKNFIFIIVLNMIFLSVSGKFWQVNFPYVGFIWIQKIFISTVLPAIPQVWKCNKPNFIRVNNHSQLVGIVYNELKQSYEFLNIFLKFWSSFRILRRH